MARGINPFDHGPLHTDMWKTEGLKQALDHFTDLTWRFGGARRDEEKSARQASASFPSARPVTAGIPEPAPRAVESATTRARSKGESVRVFPISNWTELDIWQYIASAKNIADRAALFRPRARPTVIRDGLIADGR
ncbi:phosphoadenosine phosphosulfate reductase family protein [Paracoccus sp. DMF-8]|uniref:phosphoadenosine phosphosulfate reductase domain-containing protein n=1 Tax=Paracoccus sp. DMF-8 TaxID=3019445 RepID=UPI0023E7F76A|nr:phosphoadenosine phosphosulfate reductase family protein [Paracoccus sp. DMF-8]MDF3607066.1 phosphoadenosine phosphosulfate reductase family protein [Paracoccus sp. DMF-8]